MSQAEHSKADKIRQTIRETYAEVADYEKHQQAHDEMLKAVGLDREHDKWVQKKNREKTLKINHDPNDPVVHRIFESDCGSFHGTL